MEFKIIVKKLNNTLTEDEKIAFEAWYLDSEEHRIYFDQVKQNYLQEIIDVDTYTGWKIVNSRIKGKKNKKIFFKYAASIAVLLSIGLSLYYFNEKLIIKPLNQNSVIAHKISAGTDKAILTLEDGSKIDLKRGEFFKNANLSSNGFQLKYKESVLLSNKTAAKNILTIPRGGQFFIVLADGTKIWMNSDTQLKFPVSFQSNKTREVELVYGEAYFEVSPSYEHNGTHFIVHSQHQYVEVLGTKFNIKAYNDDEIIATTLSEGKVVVNSGGISKILAPGNQSIVLRKLEKIKILDVDVYSQTCWTDGVFTFKDQSLGDIMKVLSRWYDVDVVFQNQEIKALKFNGVFRKTQPINEILNIIKNTNEINYTINQKKIIMK